MTKVTVEQTETANTVKWTANESEQTSGYRIFRKIGSGSYDLIATRAVEKNGDGSYAFADEDLRTAGTYTYKIVSVNYNGNTSSRVSGSVSVHTKPVPALNCDTAMEQGFEKGCEVGRAEGITSQRLDTARSMLADGLPLEKIMRYTGLSKEEIGKLK